MRMSPPTSATSQVSRPQARTAERREAVLQAALNVFGQRGYNKGTLAEVAARAGMTHAGVLHHFGSKQGLLVALLQYRDRQEAAEGAEQTRADARTLLARVLDTVHTNITRPEVVRAHAVLSGESITQGHPAAPYFREHLAESRRTIARALAEATGRHREEPALTDAASAIIAFIDGLQVQWLLDPDAVNMPRIVDKVIDQFIDGLTIPAGAG